MQEKSILFCVLFFIPFVDCQKIRSTFLMLKSEEEKLWYLTARIDKGSYYMIKISITDYNEKELYSLARSSHEKDNSVALIKYDIEKTL